MGRHFDQKDQRLNGQYGNFQIIQPNIALTQIVRRKNV